ncbi:MAG: T9SS type A sorting domain-containing protein [Candidatus Eisenbacteria bacterium]|uniref:T9SS type A sorting domain-containing protein n=1 Tax=Eiseniibacteriota bacterium TaxID=2212470 RepID=A0A7Y2H365_UNCEI|nr:T9SS type A sorting domain-containing protein [Candidatus Eisenbacteria bacterium]
MRARLLTVFGLVSLFTVALVTSAMAVTINEIRIDQSGSDNEEYIELAGTNGESLTGLSIIVIGDGSGGAGGLGGVVEAIVDLPASTIQPDGVYLIAEATFGTGGLFLTGTVDFTTTLNFENSDNVTFLLVSGRNDSLHVGSGFGGSDVDVNDDGIIDATGDWGGDGLDDGPPWASIVDDVALIETVGSGELVYSATTNGPDGSFVPAHSYRCSDTAAWMIGNFGDSAFDTPDGVNPSCANPPPTFFAQDRLPCVPNTTEAAAITATVISATGASVSYTVNGGAATVLAMGVQSTSGDTTVFAATIPGQPNDGDLVEYMVTAVNANPDTTDGFAQGYFVGLQNIGDLRVNDGGGSNIYDGYGARVRGNVTVDFGKFSSTRTDGYIQDATGGINIFEFDIHPTYQSAGLGDELTVAGVIDEFNGKLEITSGGACDTLLIDLEGPGAVPAPKQIGPCGVNEFNEGLLVECFYVDLDTTGTGPTGLFQPNQAPDIINCVPTTNTDVFIDADTNIPGNPITSTQYSVIGIVTEFGAHDLAPRQLSDLTPLNVTVGVGDETARPVMQLMQNNPNPFRQFTEIRYVVPGAPGTDQVSEVQLEIFDLQGRRVASVIDDYQAAGEYGVKVNRSTLGNIASGVYFYRLDINGETQTRKLIVE